MNSRLWTLVMFFHFLFHSSVQNVRPGIIFCSKLLWDLVKLQWFYAARTFQKNSARVKFHAVNEFLDNIHWLFQYVKTKFREISYQMWSNKVSWNLLPNVIHNFILKYKSHEISSRGFSITETELFFLQTDWHSWSCWPPTPFLISVLIIMY